VQTLLGHIERWLAYSQAPLEDCAGEKEVREQLKFENLVPEEKKTPEIIPILPGKFQPRKVEELLPDIDILPDTYVIYPTGGYHLFYGVPNTLPRYQEKIWPYVKRIKFSERWRSKESLDRNRKTSTKQNHPNSHEQFNPYIERGYFIINFYRMERYKRSHHTKLKNRKSIVLKTNEYMTNKKIIIRFHRLVALAWIPNPDNKPMVLHINDDRTNYLVNNLKWGTGKENQAGRIGTRPDTVEQKYQSLVDQGIIKG